MKKFGMFRAITLVSKYRKLPAAKQRETQNTRLSTLVDYARQNSPYFRELYRSLPENFSLNDLPPVTKTVMMQNFDRWVTDSDVRLADIAEFMQNKDNIGRKFRRKYLVFTTSGSTGNPSVVLYDKQTNGVMTAVNSFRGISKPKIMMKMILRGGKSAGVFATGGFYLGNSSIRARLLQMPWKKHQMMVTSVLNPLAEIVKELNAFQPAMLGGYPTAMELLMEEQKAGRLHVAPALIMTGGEYLSDDLRKALKETFLCHVQTSYACTEGGAVASECKEGHFHINEDWVIVEPVDKNNQLVADGVLSDKILLTNLSNYTQPFIRYEVTDRIRMHHEPCACGSSFPWLEIEGRTDEILTFQGEKNDVRIPPLALYALLKEVHEIRRFQLVNHTGNRLELRMLCEEGQDVNSAFEKAELLLKSYLSRNGVNELTVYHSPEEPKPHPGSGKFQHVFKAKE